MFLKEVLTIQGIAGGGICTNDRKSISMFQDDPTVQDGDKETFIWKAVVDTFKVLEFHHIPALRMNWIFDNGEMLCFLTNREIALGVLVDGEFNETSKSELKRKFDEFTETNLHQNLEE